MPESPGDLTIKSKSVPGEETVLNAGKIEAEPDIDAFIKQWGASLRGRTNEEVGLELLRKGAKPFPLSGVGEPIVVRPSRSRATLHFGSVANISSAVIDALTRHVSLPPETTVVYVPGRLAFTKDGTINPRGSEVLVLNHRQYQDIVRAREEQRQARE